MSSPWRSPGNSLPSRATSAGSSCSAASSCGSASVSRHRSRRMNDLVEAGPLGNQQKEQVIARDARTKARQRDEAFRWLMADRKGRLLMWELLDKTRVFRAALTHTPPPLFNETARNPRLTPLAHA